MWGRVTVIGLEPSGSSKCLHTCLSMKVVSAALGTRVVVRKTDGPISEAVEIRRSETFRSLSRRTLSSLRNLEWKHDARMYIFSGSVMIIPRRKGPWTVCLPWRLEGHLAGTERETAGASKGGGRLSRAGGATVALAGALSLDGGGGAVGFTLARLT
jgi:hypothetical protein